MKIQTTVPICPECGAMLKRMRNLFQCFDCKKRYRIIEEGRTDREVECEEVNYERQ